MIKSVTDFRFDLRTGVLLGNPSAFWVRAKAFSFDDQ